MVILLPLLWLFFVQTGVRTVAHAFWILSSLRSHMYCGVLGHHSHSYRHDEHIIPLRGVSGSTMGTLGRHKRRRRNTSVHGCRNDNGRGTTPLQQEDGNAIEEQASLEAHPSSRNEQEPTDMSPILQSSSPPRKSADLSIAEKAPPRKLTALSKVVVEFTAQQLSAFLAFCDERNMQYLVAREQW